MDANFIQALQAAKNPEDTAALIAEATLSTFSNEVARVARQCVLFHWFDQSIVSGLLQFNSLNTGNEQDVYKQITSLPFVEQLPWGVVYQDLTRQGLLRLYAQTQPELLKTAANVAAPLYRRAFTENDRHTFEALFCSIISGDAASNLHLNTLLEQAMSQQDWQQMENLLRLQEEAEQLSFVDPLPRIEHYWMLRSIVDRIQGKLDEAIYDYDRVLTLNPNNALAYLSRSILLGQQHQHEQSVDDYHEAFRLDPSLVQTYINRGIISPLHEYPTNIANRTEQPAEEDEGGALQLWVDINAHLQFAEQVIQKSDLQPHSRTTLHERMQRIRARQADPSMYLAVVGEFNAGKSTFINALLHAELLQTSAVVATTTPTRICYGTQIDLEVRFRNAKSALRYTQNREELWRQIQQYSHKLRDNIHNIRTYIEAVTTNNDVAAHVESVVLYYQAAFLTNKIIIIDTPAINAKYDTQRQAVSDVVQHEADAAVIVIPAPFPLSQTLTTFLTESLHSYVHRCLFVVTQMDKIQERERKRLLDSIQTRLTQVLGTNQPVVLHEAAPQIVLDTLQKQPVVVEAGHWYDDFGKLEQAIWDRLRQERALGITESLLELMILLLEELNARLQERLSIYGAHQQSIQRETIQDISAFTTQQQHIYQTQISNAVMSARYNLEVSIESQRNDAEEEVHRAIFSVHSASGLKSVMEHAVREEIEQASHAFQRELEEQIEMLKLTTVRAIQTFETRFAQEYQKIQVLAGTISFPLMEQFSKDISFNTSGISYSIGRSDNELDNTISRDRVAMAATETLPAQKVNRELDIAIGALGWGGAALGMAVGTAIFPGIGTLAGLLVGPLLVGLFGPSLQDRQAQVWDAIRPALRAYLQNMETQGLAILDEYESEVQRAFNKSIARYMQHYETIVNAMITYQQKEAEVIKNIQSDQQEIERRSISLKEMQQQIVQKKI